MPTPEQQDAVTQIQAARQSFNAAIGQQSFLPSGHNDEGLYPQEAAYYRRLRTWAEQRFVVKNIDAEWAAAHLKELAAYANEATVLATQSERRWTAAGIDPQAKPTDEARRTGFHPFFVLNGGKVIEKATSAFAAYRTAMEIAFDALAAANAAARWLQK